jgi:hypothetical protein
MDVKTRTLIGIQSFVGLTTVAAHAALARAA